MRVRLGDWTATSDRRIQRQVITDPTNPNQWQTWREFCYATFSHFELAGNSFWLKIRAGKSGKGALVGLVPLNPKYMTVHIGDDGVPDKYQYRAGAKVIEYALDQVFHLKYPNPFNVFYGQSPLLAIADWVDVDNYMTEFNRKFFVNGATFGGMIKTDATTQNAIELIRLGLDNQHKGVVNAHKIGILPKGAEFTETKQSFRDMEFNAGDQLFRDKVLSGFGVPKSVVGITEAGSSKADAEAKNYVFQKFTVKPKLEILADFLNEFFLEEFDAAGTHYFDFVNPVTDDENLVIALSQAGLANMPFMTVNEVRAKNSLPPILNGDVVMGNPIWAEVGPVADLGKEPKASDLPRMKQVKRPLRNPVSKSIADSITARLAKLLKADDPAEKSHKAFIARVGDYEKQAAVAVLKHDNAQRAVVLSNLRFVAGGVIDGSKLFDADKAAKDLAEAVLPIVAKLYADQGKLAYQDVVAQAGKKSKRKAFDMGTVTGRIAAYLDASMKKMAKAYTKTTVSTLVSELSEGVAAGEDLKMLADRVGKVYDFTEAYRAMRVARRTTPPARRTSSRTSSRLCGGTPGRPSRASSARPSTGRSSRSTRDSSRRARRSPASTGGSSRSTTRR